MLSKIHPFYFLLSFAIGLLYCYLTHPKPDVIMKFPSPYNAGKITYKDNDDSCYKYKAEKVSCPLDSGLIKAQPVAEDFVNGSK